VPGAPSDDFIRTIPKAELHVHLEGTLEPELLLELSQRNAVTLPPAAEPAARRGCQYADLQDFLDLYYAGVAVLCTGRDFYDLTAAYLQRVAADGARHVELFFDPQSHTSRGVRFDDVVEGIRRALADGERALGLSWRLIMCFLRDQSLGSAEVTLETARPWRHVICGVGLDSAETGHPPADFAALFARAREAGFLTFAHAGEEGPAAYVEQALDALGVRRIDHGVSAADDPALVERLVREQVALTMCPLSNRELQVTPDLGRHPLKRLLDAGVLVTVNSDDPAYFCGYLADNYVAARDALGLTEADIVALARNSITASLLREERKTELLREIDDVAARRTFTT
jgi:adenosine deaminase